MKKILVFMVFFLLIGSNGVQAGNWDEHFIIQSYVNELIINYAPWWLNNEIFFFVAGFTQHQIYDILVNESPFNFYKTYSHFKETGINFDSIFKTEFLSVNELKSCGVMVLGVSLSLWKAYQRSLREGKDNNAGKRLIGYMGGVFPDLMELIRLFYKGGADGFIQEWYKVGANKFHLKLDKDWHYLIDTFNKPEADIQRRVYLLFLLFFL